MTSFSKDEMIELSAYLMAAIIASTIKFLKKNKRDYRIFTIEVLTGASIAFFLIPALVRHYELSIYIGCGLTWLTTTFSETLFKKIEAKLLKKVDDVSDSIN